MFYFYLILTLIIFTAIFSIWRLIFFTAQLQDKLYNENRRYLRWIKKSFFTHIFPQRADRDLPFTRTFRFVRIYLVSIIFILSFSVLFAYLAQLFLSSPPIAPLYLLLIFIIMLILLIIALPFIVLLSWFINLPLDKTLQHFFISQAQQKLQNNFPHLQTIGITGSYGKTSTKNIVSQLLSTHFRLVSTPENFNTPLGIAKTINQLRSNTQIFVAEMGAYISGEIKELCDLTRPKYGIITALGPVHLETFGSQQKIVQTKFELITALPKKGLAILNADDPLQMDFLAKNRAKIKPPVITVGLDHDQAQIRATNIRLTSHGSTFTCNLPSGKNFKVKTQLLGRANITNLLFGIAIAHHLGMSPQKIATAIADITPTPGRLQLTPTSQYQLTLINDAYNANPASMQSALDVLAGIPNRSKKIAVLGDMLELGPNASDYHRQVGVYAQDLGIDFLITIGSNNLAKEIYRGFNDKKHSRHFAHNHQAQVFLQNLIRKNDLVLFKASQIMHFDDLVQWLVEKF